MENRISEMGTVSIKQINDHTYLLRDNMDATSYLILGSEKALLIDTMNGTENIKNIACTLTSLPVILLNTHGHPDHIGGNLSFGEALIHPDDISLANAYLEELNPSEPGIAETMTWKPILPGEKVELGELTLDIISLAGHTPGSIGILDKKSRILFSGDALNEGLWMQLDHCLPLSSYLQTLYALKDYRNQFDYLLTGHCTDRIEASQCEELTGAVEEMLEGKNENDYDTEYFGGKVKAHPFGNGKAVIYDPKRDYR
ncbi:MAG: MBL fold metallo-hydrolase [Clostridia bacterium]|nr:MBL fold metallo-hydrolase [Clostridia bacterium]